MFSSFFFNLAPPSPQPPPPDVMTKRPNHHSAVIMSEAPLPLWVRDLHTSIFFYKSVQLDVQCHFCFALKMESEACTSCCTVTTRMILYWRGQQCEPFCCSDTCRRESHSCCTVTTRTILHHVQQCEVFFCFLHCWWQSRQCLYTATFKEENPKPSLRWSRPHS